MGAAASKAAADQVAEAAKSTGEGASKVEVLGFLCCVNITAGHVAAMEVNEQADVTCGIITKAVSGPAFLCTKECCKATYLTYKYSYSCVKCDTHYIHESDGKTGNFVWCEECKVLFCKKCFKEDHAVGKEQYHTASHDVRAYDPEKGWEPSKPKKKPEEEQILPPVKPDV